MHMRDTLVIEHNKSLEYTKANFIFFWLQSIYLQGPMGFVDFTQVFYTPLEEIG